MQGFSTLELGAKCVTITKRGFVYSKSKHSGKNETQWYVSEEKRWRNINRFFKERQQKITVVNALWWKPETLNSSHSVFLILLIQFEMQIRPNPFDFFWIFFSCKWQWKWHNKLLISLWILRANREKTTTFAND